MNKQSETNKTNIKQPVKKRSRLRRFAMVLGIIFLIGFIWVFIDLFGPWSANLRQFDGKEIGHLESDMWRAYYDKKPLKLYELLVTLMRRQNKLPFVQANVTAYDATKAAMVFKVGAERKDYEKALPYLTKYYQSICSIGHLSASPEKLAKLELEWWIIHRERDKYGKVALVKALADTVAELYSIDSEKVIAYAQARAEAMIIRDEKQAAGGVSEADWNEIEEKLANSYTFLYLALNENK